MIEVSHKQVSIEDVEAPEFLYKYRTWTDVYHRRMISNQEVYMAPPSQFQDLKDCRMYRRHDYTTDELFIIYRDFLHKTKPRSSTEELMFQAIVAVQNIVKDTKAFTDRFQQQEFDDFDRMYGILSLTSRGDNLRMWEEYGDNGKGFCVAFDGMELVRVFRNYGKVEYCDKLPEVTLGEDYNLQAWKQVYNKERSWEFEEEHRIKILNRNGLTKRERTVQLPKRAFRKVIFGWDMDENERLKIIKLCFRNILKVQFYEALKNEDGVFIKQLQ